MTAMMLLSMASMLSQMDRVQAAGKRSFGFAVISGFGETRGWLFSRPPKTIESVQACTMKQSSGRD